MPNGKFSVCVYFEPLTKNATSIDKTLFFLNLRLNPNLPISLANCFSILL